MKNYVKLESVKQLEIELLTGEGKFSVVLCETFEHCRQLFAEARIELAASLDCVQSRLTFSQPQLKLTYHNSTLQFCSAASDLNWLRGCTFTRVFDATHTDLDNRLAALRVLLPRTRA